MAKAVYLGDNNSRKVKKMYEGNGTAHKIKKGYIGDSSGKARLFFSGATRWNRYTVITQYRWNTYNTIYSEQITGTGTAGWSTPILSIYGAYDFACNSTKPALNTSTGLYTLTGTVGPMPGEYIGIAFATSKSASSIVVFPSEVNLTLQSFGSTYYLYSHFMDPITYTTYSAVKSKGSFTGTVQSANQSQYPTNGISGNLWYEYTGLVNTIGSLIDTVTSDNENAYPANGISGNYWYVKIQE